MCSHIGQLYAILVKTAVIFNPSTFATFSTFNGSDLSITIPFSVFAFLLLFILFIHFVYSQLNQCLYFVIVEMLKLWFCSCIAYYFNFLTQ